MRYQFTEQNRQNFPVVVMCRVLGISPSGDDAWRKRPTCERKQEDAQLTQEIRQVFVTHRGRYGSPCIHVQLKDQGRRISCKRVARLMREADMSATRKHRQMVTTKRDVSHPVAPNIFNREVTAKEPNTTWATDITSLPTTQGWLSLAVILDLYSRAVVGWSMSACCDEELVENARTDGCAATPPQSGAAASQ